MNIVEAMAQPRQESQHARSTRVARERRERAYIERWGDPPAWRRRKTAEDIVAEMREAYWASFGGLPPDDDLPF